MNAQLDWGERVNKRYLGASTNAHMCDEHVVWNQVELGLGWVSDLGMMRPHTAHHEQHRAWGCCRSGRASMLLGYTSGCEAANKHDFKGTCLHRTATSPENIITHSHLNSWRHLAWQPLNIYSCYIAPSLGLAAVLETKHCEMTVQNTLILGCVYLSSRCHPRHLCRRSAKASSGR